MKKLTVTEADIFNYVFFPDSLSGEKKTLIEQERLFADEITFYKEMKIQLENNLKITKEAPVHHLKPVKIEIKRKPGSLPKLAAASADLTKSTEFTTFTDQSSNFLCRLLRTESKNLLYIISADERTDKKMKVILHPSEQIYHVDNISTPLVINDNPEISSIHLEELNG